MRRKLVVGGILAALLLTTALWLLPGRPFLIERVFRLWSQSQQSPIQSDYEWKIYEGVESGKDLS